MFQKIKCFCKYPLSLLILQGGCIYKIYNLTLCTVAILQIRVEQIIRASGLSFLSGIIETDILFALTNNIRYTKINVISVSLVWIFRNLASLKQIPSPFGHYAFIMAAHQKHEEVISHYGYFMYMGIQCKQIEHVFLRISGIKEL